MTREVVPMIISIVLGVTALFISIYEHYYPVLSCGQCWDRKRIFEWQCVKVCSVHYVPWLSNYVEPQRSFLSLINIVSITVMILVSISIFFVFYDAWREYQQEKQKYDKGNQKSMVSVQSLSNVKTEQKGKEEQRPSHEEISVWLESELAKIVGHENVKEQIRKFYHHARVNQIRKANEEKNSKVLKPLKPELFHCAFTGNAGLGKSRIATLIGTLFYNLGVINKNNVVFVRNSLDLLGQYQGHTSAQVNKKVTEAADGLLFIDEAYSLVSGSTCFCQEAIDTLMKHMDPPTCIIVFAGYHDEMQKFYGKNPGLDRRIPYRYHFQCYSHETLIKIFQVMCEEKHEKYDQDVLQRLEEALKDPTIVPPQVLENQNAGYIENLISGMRIIRDSRLQIQDVVSNPSIAYILEKQDLNNYFSNKSSNSTNSGTSGRLNFC